MRSGRIQSGDQISIHLLQQLLLDSIKTQALDGIGKTLTGDALVAEEADNLLHHVHNILFGGENLVKRLGSGSLLAPAATNGDFVAVGIGNGIKQALIHAATAVVAEAGVDDQLFVHHLCDLDRAVQLHLALLAAPALLRIHFRVPLTDDGQVIQFRLDTVVGAAAYGDLKLWGSPTL